MPFSVLVSVTQKHILFLGRRLYSGLWLACQKLNIGANTFINGNQLEVTSCDSSLEFHL